MAIDEFLLALEKESKIWCLTPDGKIRVSAVSVVDQVCPIEALAGTTRGTATDKGAARLELTSKDTRTIIYAADNKIKGSTSTITAAEIAKIRNRLLAVTIPPWREVINDYR